MTQLSANFKNNFNETLLKLLWSHWSALGVAGYGGKVTQMLDPEALILMTASVGRSDPRLFDAMIEWMMENERLINISRMQTLLERESFRCENVIAAVAGIISEKGNRTKWKKISSKSNVTEIRPLFNSNSGSFYGKGTDPIFREYGLERPEFRKRGILTPFSVKDPATLVLRLRAFFGVNARSEIIAYLLNNQHGVARDIALSNYYFLRTVQDALSEMTASGVLVSKTVPGKKREIRYSLAGNELAKMFSYERPEQGAFICFGAMYSALEKVFILINSEEFAEYSDMLQNSELRKLYRDHLKDKLNRSGIEIEIENSFPDGANYPQTQYSEPFFTAALNLLEVV
ncbi:MAG TPA: hypothetical protein VLJ60_02700 [bacterium]|nr:hypothetical protein [bacterium]